MPECGCKNGVLWPMASDRDDSRDYVERCDECAIFTDDYHAAEVFAERLGITEFGVARRHGIGGFQPFIPKGVNAST